MFGTNKQRGPRHFREHPEYQAGKLLVTSIFWTLQGEGRFSGVPAVFIRLTGCHLTCQFCDTFFDEGTWMTVPEIMDKVRSLMPHNRAVAVITGGEPLLQAENLSPADPRLGLVAALEEECRHGVSIETTGTFKPLEAWGVHYTVSPKAPNGRMRQQPHEGWNKYHNWDFKFVVDSDDPVYQELPDWWAPGGDRVTYVSPMNHYVGGVQKMLLLDAKLKGEATGPALSQWDKKGPLDSKKNQRNHQYAAALCMRTGARLSLQTHLFTALP